MTIVFNDDNTKAQIKDVTFCYVKMQEGGLKYGSQTEKEYTVDCVVDKATARAFKKAFPKNSCKEIDTQEFKQKFKIDPPFPDKEDQYVIKVKTNAQIKVDMPSQNLVTGDLVPYEWGSRPKVFVPTNGGVKDITMTTLVANGSRGTVAIRITENSYGRFPQLSGILVIDLIEYESSGGSGSDFGDVVGGYNKGDGSVQQVAGASVKEPSIDESNDDPFNDSNLGGNDVDEDMLPF